jgi:hypothetical protein
MGRAALERTSVIQFRLQIALALAGFLTAPALAATSNAQPSVLIVRGAPGEEEFGRVFDEAAANWAKAAETAQATVVQVGSSSGTNDLQVIESALREQPKEGLAELWIVMLGHGTWDGREAKFNLRGSDISAAMFSNLLHGFTRPVAIINAASASAPFMRALTGTNRVVVTATRSGNEENFTRFNRYIAEAIGDANADLDKDGQTSLLEAFLTASRRVGEFYKNEGRLATEHALLDDNGDGLGTPADWFRGIRAFKTAANNAPLDGMRAHQWHLIRSSNDQKLSPEQRRARDELEFEIARLRQQKSAIPENEYYEKLEALLLKLGDIELSSDSAASAPAKRDREHGGRTGDGP